MTEKKEEETPVYKQAWFWPVVIVGFVVVCVGLFGISYAVQDRRLRRRAAARNAERNQVFAGVMDAQKQFSEVAMKGEKMDYDPLRQAQSLTAKQARAGGILKKLAARSPGWRPSNESMRHRWRTFWGKRKAVAPPVSQKTEEFVPLHKINVTDYYPK